MNPLRRGLGRAAHIAVCATLTALVVSVPASAGIIASASGGAGSIAGNSGEPPVFAPFAAINVLGVDVYGPSPIAAGDVIVHDLAGADLAAATAWLTDGINSAAFWVTFSMGLDSVTPSFWGMQFLPEGPGPALIPALQGNTIGGIRITLTNTCLDATYRDNPCNLNDPFSNRVAYTYDWEIVVSDTPFDVPEPASMALIGLGVLGLASRRRGRSTR